MIEISEGLGTVMAAVVTVLATMFLALTQRKLPPPSPIPVSPSGEFEEAIDRLESAVREVRNATIDARQTIGSLGGQISVLQDATKQIGPLGERTAVVEAAMEKIDHKVEEVFEKMREVNHSLRNIQQRNMAVDELRERQGRNRVDFID